LALREEKPGVADTVGGVQLALRGDLQADAPLIGTTG
jgi:hypothetical protein